MVRYTKWKTYFILSLCVLYSMMVLGGRLRTRFSVSRIRDVTTLSDAVRFHKDKISSFEKQKDMLKFFSLLHRACKNLLRVVSKIKVKQTERERVKGG